MTRVTQVSRRVDRLEDLMADLTGSVKHLTANMNWLSLRVDQVSSNVDRVSSNVDRLSSRVESVTTNVDIMSLKVNQVTENVDKMSSRVDQVTENVDKLSARVDQTTENVDKLSVRADQVTENVNTVTANVDQLSQEMREFKNEMREESRQLSQRITQISEETRERITQVSEETSTHITKVSNEMRADRRNLNKQLSEISHKMGTMAEDLVAPSIPRILAEVVNCTEEPEMKGVRISRRLPDGRSQEYDVLAICGDYVLICEVKSKLKPEEVRPFRDTLAKARDFLPKDWCADKQIIGALATFYIDPSLLKHGERLGFIMLGVIDGLMQVLNKEGFVPKAY